MTFTCKRLTHLEENYHRQWGLSAVLLICSFYSVAQFNVQFRLVDFPPGHTADTFFIAGNFNGWQPGLNGTPFGDSSNSAVIKVDRLPAGTYYFKVTRGTWQSVECAPGGFDIEDRLLTLSSDTVLTLSVQAWKDDFAKTEKKHTASRNVHVMDTAFAMPQLGRTRRIWLYLPAGYNKSNKRYPVMYMQDGQNLFDASTSGFGEWRADETADSLIKIGKPACIIVGIDNGPERLNEYNPYPVKDVGEGEGAQYVDFIVKNLKPYIDKHYRTLCDGENTIIAGSSMGALIAYYAMLKYPQVFGKGGIFSPSFWTGQAIRKLTDLSGNNLKGTLFFYIGGQEGDSHIKNMLDITEKLGVNSSALMYTVIDPESHHNEIAWSKWFPEFYNWVLATGFNNIIKLEED